MVQASPMVRDQLGPALLHTYAAVKVFEGLDVDKEDFDKYATRYEISQLLHRLWSREDCKDSILRQCGSKKFQVCPFLLLLSSYLLLSLLRSFGGLEYCMDHTLFIYVISMDFHRLGDGLQLVRLVSLSYRIKVTTRLD